MIHVKHYKDISYRIASELEEMLAESYCNSAEMRRIYGSNQKTLKLMFRMIIAIYNRYSEGNFFIVYNDDRIVGAFAYTTHHIIHNSISHQLRNGLIPFIFSSNPKTLVRIFKNSKKQKKFQKLFYNPTTDIAIVFIAVSPEYQGKGIIAKQLFQAINLTLNNSKNIYFETVNKDARKIYEGLGFKILANEKSSKNEIVAMKKDIFV